MKIENRNRGGKPPRKPKNEKGDLKMKTEFTYYKWTETPEDMDISAHKEAAKRANMTEYMYHEVSYGLAGITRVSTSEMNAIIKDYMSIKEWN